MWRLRRLESQSVKDSFPENEFGRARALRKLRAEFSSRNDNDRTDETMSRV